MHWTYDEDVSLSDFYEESAERAQARAERCRCNGASESPCSGCEARQERAEREAEAAHEAEASAYAEASAANGGAPVARCVDCQDFHATTALVEGYCAPCAKDADDRAQSAREYAARTLAPGETLQQAMGLADDDIPF